MSDYKFQGIIVDIKADNSHASARVYTSLDNANLDNGKTQISAGALVIASANDLTKLDVATTGSTAVLGVATQDRAVGDSRPLTYTRLGLVHMIKDAAALPAGAKVIPSTQGTIKAATNSDADSLLTIGRCVEGSAAVVGGEVVTVQLIL